MFFLIKDPGLQAAVSLVVDSISTCLLSYFAFRGLQRPEDPEAAPDAAPPRPKATALPLNPPPVPATLTPFRDPGPTSPSRPPLPITRDPRLVMTAAVLATTPTPTTAYWGQPLIPNGGRTRLHPFRTLTLALTRT